MKAAWRPLVHPVGSTLSLPCGEIVISFIAAATARRWRRLCTYAFAGAGIESSTRHPIYPAFVFATSRTGGQRFPEPGDREADRGLLCALLRFGRVSAARDDHLPAQRQNGAEPQYPLLHDHADGEALWHETGRPAKLGPVIPAFPARDGEWRCRVVPASRSSQLPSYRR